MIVSRRALASTGFVLGALILGFALTLGASQSQQGSAASSQKVIKDPAEYNAYIAALNTTDPAQRARLMEAFVKQYPDSIVKIEALERAMAAYSEAGNPDKMAGTARRIVQLAPNNVRALVVVTATDRAQASGGNQASLKEGCTTAQTGLQQLPGWQKPEGTSDADFQALRNQMADIFNGMAGFCALQAKNYAQARDFYAKAFQIDPANVQDIYQLAVADLEMDPLEVNGLWYCGKAIAMLQENNAAGAQSASPYCKYKYKKYHGGEDGWDQLAAQAATQAAPPADFAATMKRASVECVLAVQAVKDNDPATLSFSDWEYVLSYRDCNPETGEAAQKTWAAIQAKQKNGEAKLKIPVKVISSTPDTIMVAITDENIQANKADMQVILAVPMRQPPAAGATINVIGVLTRYSLNPFLFVMEKAEVQ